MMQPKEKHECEQQKKPDKYERLSKYDYTLFNIEHISSTYYVEKKKKHISSTNEATTIHYPFFFTIHQLLCTIDQ